MDVFYGTANIFHTALKVLIYIDFYCMFKPLEALLVHAGLTMSTCNLSYLLM